MTYAPDQLASYIALNYLGDRLNTALYLVSEVARGIPPTSQTKIKHMTLPEKAIFLHIPKTAGTSLKHFFSHKYPAGACLIDPSDDLVLDADFDKYAFVAGHFDFDVIRRYRQPPFVVTCLRNPVERALSAYHYQRSPLLRRQIESVAGTQLAMPVAIQVLDELRRLNDCQSLAEFLAREPDLARKNLGNVQTRYIAGASAAAIHGDAPERLLEIAVANLQSCTGLLLTERLADTLGQMGEFGSNRFGSLPHDNATVYSRANCEADQELLAALDDLTLLDRELCRAAEQIVRRRSLCPYKPANGDQRLSDAADFCMDQPINGRGWHIREHGPEGWYCWCGDEATLQLSLKTAGPHILRCFVPHAASLEALQGMQSSVNGSPVALRPSRDGSLHWVEADVAADVIGASGRVCIRFQVSQTVRPSDLDPTNPDTRRLGIALGSLQLRPTSLC